jgi:transcriptional regulator with XRE-family HTH domain
MPGSMLRKFRELRNYSQDYVARKMGISQNAYSKIENNITQLTVNHIKQISQVLEVSMMDLLRDDFEIHGPASIQTESISKDALIHMLEKIKLKLEDKHPQKHDFYPVIMSLLQSVDATVASVH